MRIQTFLTVLISALFVITSIAALAIFFLAGFHVGGFELDKDVMRWLGTISIGSLTVLLVVVKSMFKPPRT
jgi:hypothetical protein